MVLAVPVQAADIPEISASYSVGLRVDSVFPDASALGALFFLGDAPACRAEAVIAAATHSAETAANADSAALPPPPASAKATAVVPPGDTLMLYFAVASRAARRAIFTMFAEVSLLTRPPPPGDAPAADGGRLELYHRRCMVGDAAMDRGRFFEARLAYDAAVAVDPGFAAAHVRLLRLTAAVGDPGPWGSGGGGGEGGMAVGVAAAAAHARPGCGALPCPALLLRAYMPSYSAHITATHCGARACPTVRRGIGPRAGEPAGSLGPGPAMQCAWLAEGAILPRRLGKGRLGR